MRERRQYERMSEQEFVSYLETLSRQELARVLVEIDENIERIKDQLDDHEMGGEWRARAHGALRCNIARKFRVKERIAEVNGGAYEAEFVRVARRLLTRDQFREISREAQLKEAV